MPVFTKQLNKVSIDPVVAVKQMSDHIRYLQEQLEHTLTTLDSSNIVEIETDKTDITTSDGSASFKGDLISIKGKKKEFFHVGNEPSVNRFVFELLGPDGKQLIYLNGNGELIVTRNPVVTIDCGEWE